MRMPCPRHSRERPEGAAQARFHREIHAAEGAQEGTGEESMNVDRNEIKRQLVLHVPYIVFGLFCTNLGEGWRMAEGPAFSRST